MNLSRAWLQELLLITLGLTWATIFAVFFGSFWVNFAIASLLYFLWHMQQMLGFHLWLDNPERHGPPFSFGIWCAAIDGANNLRRNERQRERRLEQMLDSFEESTNALPDAILVINDKGQVEWFNRPTTRMLGLHRTTGQFVDITAIFGTQRFNDYLHGDDYRQPLKITSPVNNQILLEVRLVPYGSGKRLLQLRDISRLEQLETVRQDFVANVSHEMRTPLTVMRGYLETMAEDEELQQSAWRNIIEQLNRQTSRLQFIVEDLLLLSRLENDDVKREPEQVWIQPLLESILAEARALSGESQHQISLEADSALQLLGQSDELRSLFSNLIFNAVNYTPARGRIDVLWYADRDGPIFSVADNGIGIGQQHIPRLTERFYRVDESRSSKSGGTGLGLAIVKHVLSRHGGTLTIFSKLGEGSTFSCHFPSKRMVEVSSNDMDKIKTAALLS
jgi:two-component system phosphate regulon sensor histidine kinase PhoR